MPHRRVLRSLGNGMVSDMAPGEAATAQESTPGQAKTARESPPGQAKTARESPPPRRHRLVSFVLLIVCGGTFGLIFSANKIAVTGGIPFFAYVFWQTLGAGLVLLLFAAALGRRPRLSWPHARACFVIGFFTLAFPFVLLAFIAPRLPAGVIGLGGTLSPTITYVLALALSMDRFRWLRIGGISLGLAGVLLVVLPETSLPDSDMAGWVLLSLLVPVSYASGTIAAARLAPADGDSLTMGSGLLFASSIMVFPFMAGSGQWWFFSGPMSDGDWAQIGAILINAAFFYLLLEIVRRAGPVFFSTQNYVATLAGIGWGILILAESHSVYIWGALALLFAGLFLVTRRAPRTA